MKQELKKRYVFYLCFIIVIGSLTYLLSPAPVQTKNMRDAREEIEAIEKIINFDSRFTELRLGPGTGNNGTDIWITGSVPDQVSLNELKALLGKRIPEKFNLRYDVQTTELVEDPNEAGTG